MNPLLKIIQQPKGFIGLVSTSHCMNYYFSNRNECIKYQKNACKGYDKEKIKYSGEAYRKNATNGVQDYLHAINDVHYTTIKVPIFIPTSAKYVWVIKPS